MSETIQLPVLPLRDMAIFPHVEIPLYVGRSKSLKALEAAIKFDNQILAVAQKDSQNTEPKLDDLHKVGTIAIIKQFASLPDGNLKIVVTGIQRASVLALNSGEPYYTATVLPISEFAEVTEQTKVLMRSVLRHYVEYLKTLGRPEDDSLKALHNLHAPHALIDLIAAQVQLKLQDKQDLMEETDTDKRLELLAGLLLSEIELIKIDRKIKARVRDQIEKSQKEHFLNEQLNAIQKELGNEDDPKSEIAELEKKLSQKDMPDYARQRAQKEMKRLKSSNGHNAELSVIRNYVDLLLDLPWNTQSIDELDLKKAEDILNSDHYGLSEIKERILDFLAIRTKMNKHKAPLLCLSGPPGVGKTSLAQSVAKTLNRKFERISLGGMRDEAELKGHRRTYVGALPGKILSALRKAGTSNPVILLDEIDKMGMDFRGDPASVLLEVLDPEQNKLFTDHYLDLAYDLSNVLFIATANNIEHLSPPLRDRMEVIHISGYTEDEKASIAQNFILPKERENHGLSTAPTLNEDLLRFIIRNYTRESGVRGLQKELAKVCRKWIRLQMNGESKSEQLDQKQIESLLGVPKVRPYVLEKSQNQAGLATGLAWTSHGGDVLQIEASIVHGAGKIQITGNLGDVMQESANAAVTYIRSQSNRFGLENDYFSKHDIHVHVPEGATPKDGPSAGITMALAILSSILSKPLRSRIGMTGEITLLGRVLPIGGLKEKLLAAQRYQLQTVMYPAENRRDVEDMAASITQNLKLMPVSNMDEVIAIALGIPCKISPEEQPHTETRSSFQTEVTLAEKMPSMIDSTRQPPPPTA